MPSITVTAAALQMITNAMNTLNAVRERAISSKDTALKELISTLYDHLLSVKETVIRVTDENAALRQALSLKAVMKFREPLYYQDGDNTPFCPRCFEKDNRAVHVVCTDPNTRTEWRCKACKELYFLGGSSAA